MIHVVHKDIGLRIDIVVDRLALFVELRLRHQILPVALFQKVFQRVNVAVDRIAVAVIAAAAAVQNACCVQNILFLGLIGGFGCDRGGRGRGGSTAAGSAAVAGVILRRGLIALGKDVKDGVLQRVNVHIAAVAAAEVCRAVFGDFVKVILKVVAVEQAQGIRVCGRQRTGF